MCLATYVLMYAISQCLCMHAGDTVLPSASCIVMLLTSLCQLVSNGMLYLHLLLGILQLSASFLQA